MLTLTPRRKSFLPSLHTVDASQFNDFKSELDAFTLHLEDWQAKLFGSITGLQSQATREIHTQRDKVSIMQRQLDTMQNEISVLDSHEKSERECCEKLRAEVLQCREERDGMVFKASQLNAKLQNLESRVESRRQEKALQEETKRAQFMKNAPELKCFEEYLAMYITGVRADEMKFTFTRIDSTNWEREFYFIINVSSEDYQVMECHPPLTKMTGLLSTLNTHRQFYSFLKQVRHAFRLEFCT